MRNGNYTLEYLDSIRVDGNLRNDVMLPTKISYGRLSPLFPVQGQQWAFACVCGKYHKANLPQVMRGITSSCGCHKTNKGSLVGILNTLKALFNNDRLVLTKIGTDYNKSRNWGFRCKVCGIESLKCNPYETVKEHRKFCKCSTRYVMDLDEVKAHVLSSIEGTRWINPVFPEEYITKRDYRINVTCSRCTAQVDMLYGNLVRGKGCRSCSNLQTTVRLSKDQQWFERNANDVHTYKYDYSLSKYIKARSKVEIICNHHDKPHHFWQSPDNHINKGKGCPECKKLRLKYVAFHRSEVEKNKEGYLKIQSGVYLLKLKEGLFKIGISGVLDERVADIQRALKCKATVLHYKEFNLYDSFYLENKLHKLYDYCNSPNWDYSWAGHTECFNLEDNDIEDIKQVINNYV